MPVLFLELSAPALNEFIKESRGDTSPPGEFAGVGIGALRQASTRSVFPYGWSRGISTDSSNRAMAEVVEEEIIVGKDGGKVIEPEIWL